MVDCMIASVAWRRDAALLTCDSDLVRVATVVGITMDDPNSSAVF
jgi:predicted nucleic acid-binding protein